MLIRQLTENVLAILAASPTVARQAYASVEDVCELVARRLADETGRAARTSIELKRLAPIESTARPGEEKES